MQIIERRFQNMFNEVFTGVPKYSILQKERKKKQIKYNTADQVVDIQAVLCLWNTGKYFLFWITVDKRFVIQKHFIK